MEPKIIKTKDYIEFVGHYDDIAKCAKLSALASLYALESKVGYAKFPIEYEKDIYKALNCSNIFTNYNMVNNHTYVFTNTSTSSYYVYGVFNNLKYVWINGNKITIDTSKENGLYFQPAATSIYRLYINGVEYKNNDYNIYYMNNTSTNVNIHLTANSSTTAIKMDGTAVKKGDYFYFGNNNFKYKFQKSSTYSYTLNFIYGDPPTPLTKTYNLDTFSNNSEEFNQIVVNGTSTNSSTFNTIDNIHYLNTNTSSNVTVYSNSSWASHYDSVLDYTTTAPNVTAINNDCNSIVTFTTHQVEPASNSISIGTRSLSASYVGTSEVNKIYYGTSLVYEKQASGFDVTLDGTGHSATWAGDLYGFAKIGSAPTALNDYDIVWKCNIGASNTTISVDNQSTWATTQVISNVDKLYCWAGYWDGSQETEATNRVKINNVDITQRTYNNAYELNVSQDSTFMVQGAWGD